VDFSCSLASLPRSSACETPTPLRRPAPHHLRAALVASLSIPIAGAVIRLTFTEHWRAHIALVPLESDSEISLTGPSVIA